MKFVKVLSRFSVNPYNPCSGYFCHSPVPPFLVTVCPVVSTQSPSCRRVESTKALKGSELRRIYTYSICSYIWTLYIYHRKLLHSELSLNVFCRNLICVEPVRRQVTLPFIQQLHSLLRLSSQLNPVMIYVILFCSIILTDNVI